MDVKSTKGEHGRKIHLSIGELETASEPGQRYDVYRVSELGETGGILRISEDIGAFASKVLTALGGLPPGVRPDSFSVRPDVLEWGPPIALVWSDEDDE